MSEISETEIKSMTKEQNYIRGYKDGKSDVLDKIRDEVCDIDDEIVLNPDSFYECKVYVRFNKVIDIIDKYKVERGGKE